MDGRLRGHDVGGKVDVCAPSAGCQDDVGGAAAVAQGGSFLHGFAANAIGAAAGVVSDAVSMGNDILDTAIVAAAGCAGAVFSGGKCANGAVTAAFANMYNKWGGASKWREIEQAVVKSFESFVEGTANFYGSLVGYDVAAQCVSEGCSTAGLGLAAAAVVPGAAPLKGAGMTLSRAKQIMSRWDRGSFDSRSQSIMYHYNKHGTKGLANYLESSANFQTRGAQSISRADGTTIYRKNNWYQIRNQDGKILSHGRD